MHDQTSPGARPPSRFLPTSAAAAVLAVLVAILAAGVTDRRATPEMAARAVAPSEPPSAPSGQVFVPTTGITFGEVEPLPPTF